MTKEVLNWMLDEVYKIRSSYKTLSYAERKQWATKVLTDGSEHINSSYDPNTEATLIMYMGAITGLMFKVEITEQEMDRVIEPLTKILKELTQ